MANTGKRAFLIWTSILLFGNEVGNQTEMLSSIHTHSHNYQTHFSVKLLKASLYLKQKVTFLSGLGTFIVILGVLLYNIALGIDAR